jgi:hypothetical protein
MKLISLALITLNCLLNISFAFAQDSVHEFKFVGTASCSSSNCHGSVKPRDATSVLQNEFFTWYKHDSHSQAYKTLLSADSKKIAANLGIQSAQNDKLCLSCHATYAQPDQRADKFSFEDGVSCESCHGAASGWLKSHVAKDASYENLIKQGMKDINSASEQAKLCASCHVESVQNNFGHDLYGAGHPRISLELDTYLSVMPRHWHFTDKYIKRNGNYSATKTWLYGQLELATRLDEKLKSEKFEHDFSNYYCFSCHHPLEKKEFRTKNYQGKPGKLRINETHFAVLAAVFDQSPDLIKQNLAGIKSKIETLSLSKSSLQDLLSKILTTIVTDDRVHEYQYAEQLVMGISAVVTEIDPSGKLYQQKVAPLYKVIKQPGTFDGAALKKTAKQLI